MPRPTDNRNTLESFFERSTDALPHVRFARGLLRISGCVAERLARRRDRRLYGVEESERIVIRVALFDETAPPRLAVGEPCRKSQ